MEFDPHFFPYPSRRQLVYAAKGVVAASQPLAAQAGLDILKKGGNAVDAAVACAAALTVLEPTSNGLGGDAFAIIWTEKEKRLRGLNSSGTAPARMTAQAIREKGFARIPRFGLAPITVPGIPSAWAAAWKEYGRLPFARLLEEAARLAEEGFPVTPLTSRMWAEAYGIYREAQKAAAGRGDAGEAAAFDGWFSVFAPGGKTPVAGEPRGVPAQAGTLREIGKTESRSFYQGPIAQGIDAFMKKHGGFLRGEDLAAFSAEWVDPISINYRGHDIWEIPPNGQGLVAILGLNILENFSLNFGKDHPDTCHKQIEALKLAFADGRQYIADSRFSSVPLEGLLSKEYAGRRAALVGENALSPGPGKPFGSETVYFCAADAEGNMVSWIQSNFAGFGSGIVIPESGISFQNRGSAFSLDEKSANCLVPGKRPFHTIIPGFITREGKPLGPFGIMGAAMQPQAHLQVVSGLIDFGLNPQAALDAYRWMWLEGKKLQFEPGFPRHIAEALAAKGHEISYHTSDMPFGRGQIIQRLPSGVYAAGTEKRTDGYIAVW
ncbi:MAG: gamma-glutamyltransferase family protein [Spirochaetia bacterium]|jgi:gamma-glutamyltranspeptidase/glutathione hydrolase|nr:gamma-glutamyltransferase family protein [Spirochaetia bacterium]